MEPRFGYAGKVSVIACTEKPMHVISYASGVCTAHQNTYSDGRVRGCIRSGHMSVIEHVCATWDIDGISRSCLAQLTRHRLASYSVLSQRYVKLTREDVGFDDWYVTPPSPSEEWLEEYRKECMCAGVAYCDAIDDGLNPEDARFILPEGTKTHVVVTMNAREFAQFLALRLSPTAQWEIRALAEDMSAKLSRKGAEWNELVKLIMPRGKVLK